MFMTFKFTIIKWPFMLRQLFYHITSQTRRPHVHIRWYYRNRNEFIVSNFAILYIEQPLCFRSRVILFGSICFTISLVIYKILRNEMSIRMFDTQKCWEQNIIHLPNINTLRSHFMRIFYADLNLSDF